MAILGLWAWGQSGKGAGAGPADFSRRAGLASLYLPITLW